MYIPNPNFQPQRGPPELEQYLRTTHHELFLSVLAHPVKKKRLSPFIEDCLKFRNDTNIVITDSDKNLGPVVLDTSLYLDLINTHLSDESTYQVITLNAINDYDEITSIFNAHFITIQSAINNLEFVFKSRFHSEYKWLCVSTNSSNSFTIPNFRIIPKLQKLGTLKSRPISSAVDWITTPPSRFISHILSLFSTQFHDTIIKDSKSFISQLDGKQIPPNSLLVSFDIVSLYTNLDIPDIIQTFNNAWPEVPFFVSLIEAILNSSFINFQGSIYKQIRGMPMGTNAAVEIANLYLYYRFDNSPYLRSFIDSQKILYYKRYIDDTFGVWTASKEELIEFTTTINHLIPGIKFTSVTHPSSIEFLDTVLLKTTILNSSYIHFRIHQKSLNKYLYLPAASKHSTALKRGFIKGELIRYTRNCSFETDFNTVRTKFFYRLLCRGYNRTWLSSIFLSVKYTDRQHFLSSSVDNSIHPIFFVTKSCDRQHRLNISKCLRKHLHLLSHPNYPPTKPTISLRSGKPTRHYLYRNLNGLGTKYHPFLFDSPPSSPSSSLPSQAPPLPIPPPGDRVGPPFGGPAVFGPPLRGP